MVLTLLLIAVPLGGFGLMGSMHLAWPFGVLVIALTIVIGLMLRGRDKNRNRNLDA